MNSLCEKSFKIFMLIMILILFCLAPQAMSLSVETHRVINESITQVSLLDNYLKTQLGVQEGVKAKYNGQQVVKLISDGGEAEDAGARSLYHFHNPITNQGILSHYSALAWATLPVGGQTLSPFASWYDVRYYYERALTAKDHGHETPKQAWRFIPSALRDCSTYQFRCASLSELEFHNKTTRENYFALSFRSVGQVMHLTQDMSIPAHIRNQQLIPYLEV